MMMFPRRQKRVADEGFIVPTASIQINDNCPNSVDPIAIIFLCSRMGKDQGYFSDFVIVRFQHDSDNRIRENILLHPHIPLSCLFTRPSYHDVHTMPPAPRRQRTLAMTRGTISPSNLPSFRKDLAASFSVAPDPV